MNVLRAASSYPIVPLLFRSHESVFDVDYRRRRFASGPVRIATVQHAVVAFVAYTGAARNLKILLHLVNNRPLWNP